MASYLVCFYLLFCFSLAIYHYVPRTIMSRPTLPVQETCLGDFGLSVRTTGEMGECGKGPKLYAILVERCKGSVELSDFTSKASQQD